MSKYSLSSLLINKILTILSMHVSAGLEATGLYERRTANSFYPYPGESILQGNQLGDFTPLLAHNKPFCRLCTLQPGSRSEEHTSELQSRGHLVCRLLLEKKKQTKTRHNSSRIPHHTTS